MICSCLFVYGFLECRVGVELELLDSDYLN